MVQSVIQHSFHAGEWAPALYARVDLAKYKSGAALLENFYVDYRGGASSRPGLQYVLQVKDSSNRVRLLPFQAAVDVGYILEFGHTTLRFFNNGAPILQPSVAVTGVSGNTITSAANPGLGDWVYIEGVNGISNINGKYFIVTSTGATFTVTDLRGNAVSFTGAYVSGGTASVVYTIVTPYIADDLLTLKFTQSVDRLFICHPNYPPNVLTLISSANWTLVPIHFGSGVPAPSGLVAPSTSGGVGHFLYVVTALDINGQESAPSNSASTTINITAGTLVTVNLTWNAVSGAQSYNVYRSPESDTVNPPAGVSMGFISNVTAPNCDDTFYGNVAQLSADFSITPPIPQNPFGPPGVASVTITNPGAYTSVPTVTFAAPTDGVTAIGSVVLGAVSVAVVTNGTGWSVGAIATASSPFAAVIVTSVDGGGGVLTVDIFSAGSITSGNTPGNPVTFGGSTGSGGAGTNFDLNVTWGVVSVSVLQAGYGYTSAPAVTFSSGAAAGTAVLNDSASGNPSVPGLFQQRLVLAAKPSSVQTFNMSQTGSYYDFDIRNPILADDAIEGTLVSGQLNKIVSMISVPTGLVMMTSSANWLISAGGQGAAVTPIDIQANAHSYNGASDVPPIVANFDILFVQSKGSIVRDLAFNFYTQIFTGTDISVLSSHLFYGYTITEWCWAEEPFKVVWCIRNDGTALSLTFLKEQELIGWSHSITEGSFRSTATVTEPTDFGYVDAVYFVVERVIEGQTVQYIERLAQRIFPNGATDAWCVDAGLQYDGAPATSFSGAEHLAGATVTGVADGTPITPFVMNAAGTFTLSPAASKVTIGLAFEPRLQTLPLDIGEPTIQGKRKGINGVTVRVQETLGLQIGKDFSSTVPMKDLVIGNVGSATNEIVTDLVTGDARTIIDPSWDVPGQYCIKQPLPLPATILGVIPEIGVGDTK